ncbi:hypothetical protein C8R43DRAFT_1124538 [Mycena crocata]|nr:hypothetical protein C8R43DRAFT_1124538 [Mycena crocata]
MHTSTKRLSCNHGTLWVHPPNTLGASTERAGCTHRTPWVHPPNALGAPTERSGCIHRTPWVHPPNALGATTGATMGAPTNPGSAHSHWERPGLRWVHPPARSKRSKPLPIPNFKKEGKGTVYINGRRRRRRWMRYRSGRQNHLTALRALELKVGHTSWLPRRVTQYRGCQSGAQKIVWYGYISAQRRMHVERRVHMALERRGIHPVRGECAGDDCNTDHKEYFPMLLIRRFSRLLRIVRNEMVLAQEVDLKFYKMRDWPPP